jgi:hypothetical protein
VCFGSNFKDALGRSAEKDSGKPGCPNDHRSQVLARDDEVSNKNGDFCIWRTFALAGTIILQSNLSTFQNTGVAGPSSTPDSDFRHAAAT